MSVGEDLIYTILVNSGYCVQREVFFKDLKAKQPLRFDFGIYIDGELSALIEFQGRQHYEFTPFFHKNHQQFYAYQEHDRRKIGYCLAHNIPIYIIPYTAQHLLSSPSDILNPRYLATTKWHNDLNKPESLPL